MTMNPRRCVTTEYLPMQEGRDQGELIQPVMNHISGQPPLTERSTALTVFWSDKYMSA